MKLYCKFLAMHIKSQMQYKISFILVFISQFMRTFFMFLSVKFIFSTFKCVAGFSYDEILLCFSVVSFSFSFSKCISEGFNFFSTFISNSEFDTILIRPRNSAFQVLVSKMDFHQIGALIQSIILLIYAILNVKFSWDIQKSFILFLMLTSGICIFLGLSIIHASLCFFTIEPIDIIQLFISGGQEFGKYPFIIYGQFILNFFTYVVPLALFQYYPLLYLIDKDKSFFNAISPLFGMLFLIPCIILWNFGVKNYKSVGS